MKKTMVIVLIGILLLSSCTFEKGTTARLKVQVASATSRDMESFTGEDKPTSFDVTVKGLFSTEGNQYEETKACTEGAAVFKDAPIGMYEITARSYNSKNVQLGEGKKTVEIKPGENNITMAIDKRVGTGDLVIHFIYEPEIYLEGSTTMSLKVENSKGETVYTIADTTHDKDQGKVILAKRGIPTDLYTVTFQIFSHGVLCDGEVAAFEVYNGCTFENYRIYNRNPFGATASLTIDNKLSQQIRTSITGVSNGGSSYTLTCNIRELPPGTEEKDLTYAWYRNGILMEGENGKTLSATKTGIRYHYNCMVKSNKIGGTSTANYYL